MAISTASLRVVGSTADHAAPGTVGAAMRPGVVTCARSATTTELQRMMDVSGRNCIVILSNGHRADHFPVVWGLITREDLARPLAEGDRLATAEELARTPVVRARLDLGAAAARSLCDAVGVSHLLVIDTAHGTPLGTVSDEDLAAAGC